MVTTTTTTLISKSNGSKHANELYQKINSITTYQRPYIRTILNKLGETSQDNANLICDYIINEQNTFNIKESTKEGKIKVLVWLANHFHDEKKFIDMTKHDIVSYLHRLRKPISEDPKQNWIGSYNIRQLIIVSFFKWLFDPGESDYRARKIPECVNGIKKLPTREKSKYTSSDIWSEKEIGLFLIYCPNKRDRYYLAMAFDMSARPSEILNLKIKDILFKKSDQQIQYAEVEIKGGKTGTRIVPLIDSIPYVKDWIENGHPNGNNPDSWLFVSLAKTNFGFKLTYDGLLKHFKDFYKNKYFPQLVSDSSIPQADRSFIKNILTKPFCMYIFRHSALTQKSILLKDE